jgi:hypothetical protein
MRRINLPPTLPWSRRAIGRRSNGAVARLTAVRGQGYIQPRYPIDVRRIRTRERALRQCNNTAEQHDGRVLRPHQARGRERLRVTNQWPSGSGYPTNFVIGDLYTHVYEAKALIDEIELYTL